MRLEVKAGLLMLLVKVLGLGSWGWLFSLSTW